MKFNDVNKKDTVWYKSLCEKDIFTWTQQRNL